VRKLILITGSSGFVGKNLFTFLHEHANEVVGISLRDRRDIPEIDNNASALIHLAGKAHDTANSFDDQEYYNVNKNLTIELFNKYLLSEIKDFIYFSSVKAAADSVVGKLGENVVCNPLTPYGKSKLQAEQYLLQQQLPKGKRLFIIRPCMIHGPGNKGNLNLLYNLVKKRIPWPLASFENKRSFLSIDNLNYIINSILENPNIKSGIYNLADDDPISTNDLIKLISMVNGIKARLLSISPSLITLIAKVGDMLDLPLNSEMLKKLTENYIVDNSKIKFALNIKKMPVSSRDGLIQTFKSFS